MKNSVYKLLSSRVWDICWLITGIILVIISTVYTYDGTVNILLITSFAGSIVGMLTVNLLANKTGKLASGIGMAGACLDAFNHYNYGLSGNVLVAIYCGAVYLKGFLTLDKKIKVTKFSKKNLYVCSVICLLGVVILCFYGSSILPENAPLWVLVVNIAVFLVQIISQYLMIEGKAIAWFGWILANVLNISLQIYMAFVGGEPETLIYLAMTIMYLLNAIKAVLVWYGSKKEQKLVV